MTRTQTLSLAIAAVVAALAAGWMAGRVTRDEAPATPAAAAPQAERKLLYYRNPMGLPDTSPVPKKDAMGMDYIPVYAGDEPPAAPGTVVLSSEKVQALGVRTERVRFAPLATVVRTSGTVEVDETRQYDIAPRFEGWVERLYANQTGMRVRAGQALLAVYSPQLAAAQQEYRLADAAARRLASGDSAGAASMARLRDAARARLRNWDISEAQLSRLGRESGTNNLVLTSPADAVVIEKPVVQGARFEAGETILRLADLSTVWVIAKVPAAQAATLSVGQPARFESVTLPGETFTGEVAFVQPIVDASTRTVDVRIALPNRDGDLRPGLFGTALIEQPTAQPALSIPRSALLDTGTRQLVLVESAAGRFSSREVKLGRRAGERVEVLDGLTAGESVVVAANFLIDAESNLQSALHGLGDHAGHGSPAGGGPVGTQAPQRDERPSSSGDRSTPPGAPPTRPVSAPVSPAVPARPRPPEADRVPVADPHAGHGPASTPPPTATDEPADHTGHEGH
jgi:Cu(I)/Ag(I) efflux system membrane fusion protein